MGGVQEVLQWATIPMGPMWPKWRDDPQLFVVFWHWDFGITVPSFNVELKRSR